jgi:mitochondrial fission protein ELM1
VWLVKELEKCAAPHSSFVVEQGNTACNPYISVLAASDVLLVTADSISMISEACATQKPVYIFPLAGFSRKLSVLHEAFYDTDSARPFLRTIDRWSSPIKDRALETVIVTVAAKVQDFFSAQKFGTRKSSV